jgi:hypothetical protein
MVFPAWLYHRTENPRLVRSSAELEALGPDWADTPAKFAEAAPAAPAIEEIPAPIDQLIDDVKAEMESEPERSVAAQAEPEKPKRFGRRK